MLKEVAYVMLNKESQISEDLLNEKIHRGDWKLSSKILMEDTHKKGSKKEKSKKSNKNSKSLNEHYKKSSRKTKILNKTEHNESAQKKTQRDSSKVPKVKTSPEIISRFGNRTPTKAALKELPKGILRCPKSNKSASVLKIKSSALFGRNLKKKKNEDEKNKEKCENFDGKDENLDERNLDEDEKLNEGEDISKDESLNDKNKILQKKILSNEELISSNFHVESEEVKNETACIECVYEEDAGRDETFSCTDCDKKFNVSNDLTLHLEDHKLKSSKEEHINNEIKQSYSEEGENIGTKKESKSTTEENNINETENEDRWKGTSEKNESDIKENDINECEKNKMEVEKSEDSVSDLKIDINDSFHLSPEVSNYLNLSEPVSSISNEEVKQNEITNEEIDESLIMPKCISPSQQLVSNEEETQQNDINLTNKDIIDDIENSVLNEDVMNTPSHEIEQEANNEYTEFNGSNEKVVVELEVGMCNDEKDADIEDEILEFSKIDSINDTVSSSKLPSPSAFLVSLTEEALVDKIQESDVVINNLLKLMPGADKCSETGTDDSSEKENSSENLLKRKLDLGPEGEDENGKRRKLSTDN